MSNKFFAIEGSYLREVRSGSRELQVAPDLPQSSAGYDCVNNATVREGQGIGCRNNATVERRPEAVGWAPLVCAGPLTTSLRGLWVSGLLPPGNGGPNEGAATQKTDRATQRGGDPKNTDLRKEDLSKQLGCEGKGPENPGVVAPLTFYKLSRQLLVGLNEYG